MNTNEHILIVDDEIPQLAILKLCFSERGYSVYTAESGTEALSLFEAHHPPVVIADVRMPGMDGLDLLKELKSRSAGTEVILITAYGDLAVAIEALKNGAADFILKPLNLNNLVQVVHNALNRSKILSMPEETVSGSIASKSWDAVITQNDSVKSMIFRAKRAARSDASILIRGESGTGKELVARAIQKSSLRADNPFVIVNCAALNENLLESELFGHCKGAFTGALNDRIGRFEEADGGTVFLDEIGDFPLSVQVKLLRILQDGEFQKVGDNTPIHGDIRIIAATNRNLERMISVHSFREDLYYRLNVIQLRLPPLRERRDDILLLADHFLKKHAAIMERPVPRLSSKASQTLLAYAFPGNIRELENSIHRSLVLTDSDEIRNVDIKEMSLPAQEDSSESYEDTASKYHLPDLLESVERHAIENALRQARGDLDQAAELLGISKRQLRYRKQKLDIV